MKNKVLVTVPIISCLLLAGCQFIQGDVGTISNEQTNQAAGTLDNIEVNPEVEVGVTVDNSENITNETTNKMTIDEYESLKKENITLENENQELKKQLGNNPSFEFKTLGLYIDGESIPINSNDSVVVVNGVNYYSEDIVNKLVPNNKNMTIDNNCIYIGRVVADKANLLEQWVVDDKNCHIEKSITDSYGNIYSNALVFGSYGGNIIYNLEEQYSYLKVTIGIEEDALINHVGIINIKADDDIVYTSKNLTKMTEAYIEENIPLNNCKLLTIEYSTESYQNDCILADVEVYN